MSQQPTRITIRRRVTPWLLITVVAVVGASGAQLLAVQAWTPAGSLEAAVAVVGMDVALKLARKAGRAPSHEEAIYALVGGAA